MYQKNDCNAIKEQQHIRNTSRLSNDEPPSHCPINIKTTPGDYQESLQNQLKIPDFDKTFSVFCPFVWLST